MRNEYTPENTPNKLFIYSNSDLTIFELIEAAKSHFGNDVDMDAITITSEFIHTRCINYDLYDASDYDDYIIMERQNA